MNKKIVVFLQFVAFIAVAGSLVWFSEQSTSGSVEPKAQLRMALSRAKKLPSAVKANEEPDRPELAYHGYQKDLAYHGFTTYPESGSEKVFLVNMSGEIVHQWDFDAARFRLLPNCNVLVIHGTKWGMNRKPWDELRYSLREYDFDGNLVWEYKSEEPFHHDIQQLENGNIIAMRRIEVPPQRMISVTDPQLRNLRFRSDEIIEVSRDKELVWSWKAHDEISPASCGKFPCPPPVKKEKERKRQYDWTHTNTAIPLPENRWYREGDTRFKPGNILIMPRNLSTAMIVDKESGEIVWDYQGDYKGGLSYGHEPHMIPEGLPGAGNILIFDNGFKRNTSYILEINPVTKEVVWVYDAGKRFFSKVAGSMQRLPNGNTLISEDVRGRAFEVTPDKKIVWEYNGNHIRSARAHRYAPDHCPRLKEFPLH